MNSSLCTQEALRYSDDGPRDLQTLLAAVHGLVLGAYILVDEQDLNVVGFSDQLCALLGHSREEFAAAIVPDVEAALLLQRIQSNFCDLEISFEKLLGDHVLSRLAGDAVTSRLEVWGRKYTLLAWSGVQGKSDTLQTLAGTQTAARILTDHSPDGVARYDRNLRRVFVNQAMRNFLIAERTVQTAGAAVSFAEPPAEYIAAIRETFRTGRSRQIQVGIALSGATIRWGLVHFSPELDGNGTVAFVVALLRDVTEFVTKSGSVGEFIHTDPLTGLMNRAGFNARFSDVLKKCRQQRVTSALLILDLDCFKDVNDTLGHCAGDDLLCQVSNRLLKAFPYDELIARVGGDEFALVLPQLGNQMSVDAAVDRIREALEPPFRLGQSEISASLGIGVAVYPVHGKTADELFAHADSAMYEAKTHGRGRLRHYSPDLTERSALRFALSSDLRKACEDGQFILDYQVKVALDDGRCLGAEALLRWCHPERGLLAPNVFIPIAEETGAIIDIGRYVLVEACRTAAEWNKRSAVPLRMAVNLSSRQFANNDIVADVAQALSLTGCRGEWLECEITESLLLSNDDYVHAALAAFGEMGVAIAIDDFGTGHSALSYLNRFHVDVLKIDRSFVGGMEQDRRRIELVKAFISIAKALELETVAEGVESTEQARLLHELGCSVGQGYMFGRPVAKHVFESMYL